MAVEGGMKCIKILVFIFNLIFVLVGLALIITGALVATRFNEFVQVMGAAYSGTPIVIGVAGAIIFIIAFFGCCGAFQESHCMVTTFAFLLVVILIVQIACGIAGFVLKDKVEAAAEQALKDSLKLYNNETLYTQFIDSTQSGLHCCGVSNYTNFYEEHIYPKPEVPKTCCKATNCNTEYNPAQIPTQIYTVPCKDALGKYLKDNIGIVAGIAVGVCFIQVIGIAFACCLSRSLKEYEYV